MAFNQNYQPCEGSNYEPDLGLIDCIEMSLIFLLNSLACLWANKIIIKQKAKSRIFAFSLLCKADNRILVI